VELDLSPLVTKPLRAQQPYYVRLVAKNKNRANPTPWLVDYASFTKDGTMPKDEQCPS